MKAETKTILAGNLTGAFADGAVLFPLLVALSLKTGMDGAVLLATAGAAYIAAGIVFRVPMAVQPLKSVVVAALALGASAAEVRWSGFAVGAACLALSFCQADRLARLAPRHLVHGLQLALGIMLLMKGLEGGFSNPDIYMKAVFAVLAAGVIIISLKTSKPVMGWVAAAGMAAGIFAAFKGSVPAPAVVPDNAVHAKILLALILPQMALTLANSVIGTHDVALRYFGENAKRVTPARLLRLIGIGNILVAPLGGLPFCHGAGGVTAHVKGGAKTWHMNLIAGGVLLGLAALSLLLPSPLIPAYPKILMAALLVATGWFHLYLAAPSWRQADLRWILLLMGLVALATQDMLWVLAVGIACEAIRRFSRRSAKTLQ
jgi:MFS superfamily sulfate permease-like transporter